MDTPESLPSRPDAVTYREHFESLIAGIRTESAIWRPLFEQRIAAGDALLQSQLLALVESVMEARRTSQLAIDKSDQATDKRLDAMNAVRDQLKEQAATFATRDVMEEKVTALEKLVASRAEANAERIARLELKTSSGVGWLTGAGAMVALALTLLGLIIRYVAGK